MQQNGAVGKMAVAIRKGCVRGRKFTERKLGEGRAGDADELRDVIADGFDGLLLALAGGQLLGQLGGLCAFAGTVEESFVQFLPVGFKVSGKEIDARHINPFGRKLRFGWERFDVFGAPIENLRAADYIRLFGDYAFAAGDHGWAWDA